MKESIRKYGLNYDKIKAELVDRPIVAIQNMIQNFKRNPDLLGSKYFCILKKINPPQINQGK